MVEDPYTLEGLEKARAELKRLTDAWDNYSGNNPNKYQSQIKSARLQVSIIESALKANGTIPLTEHEQLERELDRLHPDAESKLIVEHNGKRYQRWYAPAAVSNSGKTVQAWDRGWREVTG